ncbi:gibberellin-regulated protein 1 [Nicotiana tabacum]|uniref:Gibberellin-regulated protein 1 n=1 Tax=Nicotiana tabacum TaxID=4097 RepID=I3VFF2_TOBAC|nr:gibberellin-regulated protein 1-like [Nicotiana tomentosiformis]XP_016483858.1 PREDICTED: gibberellin-regulated protein 1-like [Nicotiana tabacum]AFK78108.1 snakin-2-like protein [Nicotiana tabacum]
MAMAIRLVFVMALLLLFLGVKAEVSLTDPKVEEDKSQHFGLSQAFRVFTRGANRRLVQGVVLKLVKYLNNGDLAVAPAPAPHPSQLDCGGLCKYRCSLHSRPKVCIRACGTCCLRCKCVPPGTFGNREMCGKCYTEMTTHGNKTKCP